MVLAAASLLSGLDGGARGFGGEGRAGGRRVGDRGGVLGGGGRTKVRSLRIRLRMGRGGSRGVVRP